MTKQEAKVVRALVNAIEAARYSSGCWCANYTVYTDAHTNQCRQKIEAVAAVRRLLRQTRERR